MVTVFVLKSILSDSSIAAPVSFHFPMSLLLLLSRFSRVGLCATPWTAAYQASPILQAITLQWVAISFSNA